MGIFGILFCLGISGWAAEYPTRSITIINPYAPGGTLDLQSRAFAAVAEKIMGQPMVVVNKPGATGMIGGLAGAQAAPDGYTLTVASTAMTAALEWAAENEAYGRRTWPGIRLFDRMMEYATGADPETLGPAHQGTGSL
jgi:tripartite-type tricarboxylate transporter receptor subunit TctC